MNNLEGNDTSDLIGETPTDDRVRLIEEQERRLSSEQTVDSKSCLHPDSFTFRLLGLVFMCAMGFGSYFCFDNPGALQNEIKTSMHVTTYEFASLYAWYAWPNAILPIIGGYLMDSVLGVRLATNLFAFIVFFGQILMALGAFSYKFYLMEVGRFIFGIGGESLAVAQNSYAVRWFKGKELNMVFGFQISVSRFGSTVNFLLMSPLYEALLDYINRNKVNKMMDESPGPGPGHTALGYTFLIASLTIVISCVSSLILGCMDDHREKCESRRELVTRCAHNDGQNTTDRNFENSESLNDDIPTSSHDNVEEEAIQLRDILTFPLSFWILCLICLAYYGAIFPFISLGQGFFRTRFSFDSTTSNFITGLIYLISAPMSPLLGYVIDKTGRNLTYVFIAISATLSALIFILFFSDMDLFGKHTSHVNVYICVSVMGLGYSLLASALWPIAALVVPEYQLGTAYGFMQSVQNLGMAIITMISGRIVDTLGYFYLQLFFMAWLSVSLVGTLYLWSIDIWDSSTKGYLNMSIEERVRHEELQLQTTVQTLALAEDFTSQEMPGSDLPENSTPDDLESEEIEPLCHIRRTRTIRPKSMIIHGDSRQDIFLNRKTHASCQQEANYDDHRGPIILNRRSSHDDGNGNNAVVSRRHATTNFARTRYLSRIDVRRLSTNSSAHVEAWATGNTDTHSSQQSVFASNNIDWNIHFQ